MGADPRSAVRRSGASPQVAIVGCVFAGLFVAQVLSRKPVEVTVIDRTDRMWVTDLAGSIYLANLDGAGHKQILAAQGNLTGIAYTELPARS
jgi:hypothetical protein